MISKYKYIFLDVDGVLLSSIGHYTEVYRRRAESLGAPKNVPDDFYKKNIGVRIDSWLPPIIPEENHSRIPEVFSGKNKDISPKEPFTLIEGSESVLNKVRQNNQKTCLVSTMTRRSLDLFIKDYALKEFLDFSVSGDEVTRFKPDPEGILKSLRYFEAGPEEAVFIGDSLHDLGAARGANVSFIGVLTGICTREDWESEKVRHVPSINDLYQT